VGNCREEPQAERGGLLLRLWQNALESGFSEGFLLGVVSDGCLAGLLTSYAERSG
jgi:hypothetical protein